MPSFASLPQLQYAEYLQSCRDSQYYPEYPGYAQDSRYPEYPYPGTYPLERSDSVPSVDFSGILEHQPVQPKWGRGSTNQGYYEEENPRPRPRPRSDPVPQAYPHDSGLVNPDIIDQLDSAGMGLYHHEGPYDAVCAERNRTSKPSPIEALRESNAEALKATPRERIVDSVENNRPLDGTAYFPPGHTDQVGHRYDYEEGANMMNDYGNFVRFPGLVCLFLPLFDPILTLFRNSPMRISRTTRSTRVLCPNRSPSSGRC